MLFKRLKAKNRASDQFRYDGEKRVSTLWVGNPMSPVELMCVSTFLRKGFVVEVFTDNQDLNAPVGTIIRSFEDVMPDRSIFENPNEPGTYANFADIFRYRLLRDQNTTWIDTDVTLLADDLPRRDTLFGLENAYHIAIGVLRFPTGSILPHRLYDVATSVDPITVSWGQTGPKLLTTLVDELGLRSLAQPINVFYPVHFRDAWMFYDPASRRAVQKLCNQSSTVHLWSEILRRAPLPVKWMAPPKGSFLREMYDLHDIAVNDLEEIDPDWVVKVWKPILIQNHA